MADGWKAACAGADFPPAAAHALPNDPFGARVIAMPRDAIKAVQYILCIIGLPISYTTKHAFQCMLAQALCVHQIHPLGF